MLNILKKIIRSILTVVVVPIAITLCVLLTEKIYSLYLEHLASEAVVISATALHDEEVQKIYQVLKDVTELFDKFDIQYSVCSGTLLGAVRHAGLIPWDDDIDLTIFDKDEKKLQNLTPLLNELGYDMYFDYIYRIVAVDSAGNRVFPIIDVYVMRHDSDKKLEYVSAAMQKRYPNEWFFAGELFPLKPYQFGPIKVYGPSNPIEYLKRNYSASAMEEIHIYPRHNQPKHNKRFIFKANAKSLQPAVPKKKLIDKLYL